MRAIAHAQTIISWQENLVEEDMPPEWMWHLDDELDAWFDDVKRRYESRSNNRGREEPAMVDNDLVR